jgi:hypothetical protein
VFGDERLDVFLGGRPTTTEKLRARLPRWRPPAEIAWAVDVPWQDHCIPPRPPGRWSAGWSGAG